MSELTFSAVGSRVELYAAVPTLSLRVRIEESTGEEIHAIALRAQVQIEPRRRAYSKEEETPLLELFGDRRRWADTQKTLLLAQVTTMVPGFTGSVEIDLPIVCTYDFEVAAAKYLNALAGGEVPLLVLFSGTLFVKRPEGFGVEQVPWEKEAAFRLPVSVWKETMDRFFPGCAWLRLRKESFDALYRFKAERGLPTWEQTVEALLAEATQRVS